MNLFTFSVDLTPQHEDRQPDYDLELLPDDDGGVWVTQEAESESQARRALLERFLEKGWFAKNLNLHGEESQR